jgi:hypothetical protein
MLKTLPTPKRKPANDLPCHDFTVVNQDANGNVVLEVNAWCDRTQEHSTVTLCLYPEEARLFAEMMTRHAEEAIEQQASGTRQYGT